MSHMRQISLVRTSLRHASSAAEVFRRLLDGDYTPHPRSPFTKTVASPYKLLFPNWQNICQHS
jgi:hypothetical protein